MKTREDQVRQFNKAMGQPDKENLFASDIDLDLLALRLKLILEECSEVRSEVVWIDNQVTKERENHEEDGNKKLRHLTIMDIADLFKELGDLQYTLSGLCATYDIPMDEIMEEVHQSNMSKLGDNGKPITRGDGKILKGPNYQEANMSPIVSNYYMKFQKGTDEPTFI